MQHIYQPVMIKELLASAQYAASTFEIASKFLVNDEPQLQYYKEVTRQMPGRILRRHDIVTYDSENDRFALNVDGLGRDQINDLVRLYDAKIAEYEQRYGRRSIWYSGFAGARDVSGPLVFQVLKRDHEERLKMFADGLEHCEETKMPREVYLDCLRHE